MRPRTARGAARVIRRMLLAVTLSLVVAVGLWAATPPRVQWTHDGAGVTRFECVIDDGTPTTLTTTNVGTM